MENIQQPYTKYLESVNKSQKKDKAILQLKNGQLHAITKKEMTKKQKFFFLFRKSPFSSYNRQKIAQHIEKSYSSDLNTMVIQGLTRKILLLKSTKNVPENLKTEITQALESKQGRESLTKIPTKNNEVPPSISDTPEQPKKDVSNTSKADTFEIEKIIMPTEPPTHGDSSQQPAPTTTIQVEGHNIEDLVDMLALVDPNAYGIDERFNLEMLYALACSALEEEHGDNIDALKIRLNNIVDKFTTTKEVDNEVYVPHEPSIGGIQNGGSSCYLNSIIQALRPIYESLGAQPRGEHDSKIHTQLKSIFQTLENGYVTKTTINEFRNLLRKEHFKDAKACSQEDAYEALQALFRALNIPQINFSQDGGDDKRDDAIQLKIGPSIQEQITQEQIHLILSPDILPVRLERFSPEGGIVQKNQSNTALEKYITVPITGNQQESALYRLKAITVHRGETLASGHYVSYVRGSNEEDEKWKLYDDATVSQEEDIQNIEEIQTSGYLYFYERVKV